ncbi:MAG: hypothetical protein ABWK05_08420 [Pyrobaculum sp.]
MTNSKTKIRGLTTVEALLIAAAFIIVGVIGVLTFQNIGKSAAESVRANAIATADRGGFDVTIEVLNGKISGVVLQYAESGQQSLNKASNGQCITGLDDDVSSEQLRLVAGQSATCRFGASLNPGTQYTYVIVVVDGDSGKAVQIAKGVVTVGIS